jgi:geranylgeranyl diphosphate synthase type I
MTERPGLFLDKYLSALEEELREALARQDGLLHNMLLYQLGWLDEHGDPVSSLPGGRLHPHLCMLSCESLLGEYTPALPAAAAVELAYNFSLIHEDVQSGNPDRGPRPTLWWLWGPGQAINAGDGMHAFARMTLMRLQDRGLPVTRVLKAMQLFDQSCLSMCEGQHMDLVFQEKLDIGVDSYLKMASVKTGALIACATGLGALAATEDASVVNAFKEFGKNLGVAYQIKDDIRDIWGTSGGETSTGNVLIKKKLFPIVYALENADLPTKRELGTIYFKRVLEPHDVKHITEILDTQSALTHAEENVGHYCQKALDCLTEVKLSQWGRDDLEKMCRDLTARDR